MSLSKEDQDDDLLHQLLRDSAADAVPDDGFVDTVMSRLPAPRRRSNRAVWLGLASGVGFAAWQLQDNPMLSHVARDWSGGQFSMASALVLVLVVITACCTSTGVLTK
ncbi:hypothetical protein [Rheinheimera sp.]|uniref:hypothetical protein n=1 Tax=Rheinheimera sp. TaxID=1869214 RepID=UPI003D29CC28